MSSLSHRAGRWGLLGILTCSLALAAVPSADAANLRLISLTCNKTQESGGDELRLDVLPDTGAKTSLRQNLKKGQFWGIDKQVPFNKSIRVSLTEIDTVASDGVYFPDEHLGTHAANTTFGVGRDGVSPETRYMKFTGNGCDYVLADQVIANAGREVELISLRCVVTQEKDSDGDELRLRIAPDGAREFTLPKNGIKAGQTWTINRKVQFFTNVRVRLVEKRRLRHQLPRRGPPHEGPVHVDQRHQHRGVHGAWRPALLLCCVACPVTGPLFTSTKNPSVE